MKIQFSDAAKSKLSQLSMAIEIYDKQRFAYRNSPQQILLMLKHATTCPNQNVKDKLIEFFSELSDQALSTLESLGIETQFHQTDASPKKKRYRGRVVESDENETTNSIASNVKEEANGEQSKKKKIVYRGKVTYV